MLSVVRAGTDLGPVFEAAREFGLPETCRFVTGTLDQYAGAIGTGAVRPGDVCQTTGTVLAAVRCSDRLENRPEIFQGPSFDPNRFFQMAFSSTSANLLDWYRSRLPGAPSYDELTRWAFEAPESDLVIEPYADCGSLDESFRHVRSEHTPGQVVRAVMQRVAQSLAEQIDALSEWGRPIEIRSAGGAARNDLWLQIKADTLGVPFVALESEEPTSLGAAMLAASAVGLGDINTLARQWVKVRKRFDPK
ncbi:MAG: hypothetical protein H0X11_09050 [Betaproteobacteria bacterium]|nr:hypothetical protein [Betaproteobacteria bacterium]